MCMTSITPILLCLALQAHSPSTPIAEIQLDQRVSLWPSGRGDLFLLLTGDAPPKGVRYITGQGEPSSEPVVENHIHRRMYGWNGTEARQLEPAFDSTRLPPDIVEAIYVAKRAAYIGDSQWYQTSSEFIRLWNGTKFAVTQLPPLPKGATIAAVIDAGPTLWITWAKRDPNQRLATELQTIRIQDFRVLNVPSPERGLVFIPFAHYGRFTYGGAIELKHIDDFLPGAPNPPYRLFAWNGRRLLAIQPTDSDYPWRMLGEAKGWVYARQLSPYGMGIVDWPGDQGGKIYRWPVGDPAQIEPVEIRLGPGELVVSAVLLPDLGRLGVQVKAAIRGEPDRIQIYEIRGGKG